MDNFDPKKMPKITYPRNSDKILWLEADGSWSSSDIKQTCITRNYRPGFAVLLGAKLHPVNNRDRTAMITSLQKEIKNCQALWDKYSSWPPWNSMIDFKDICKEIERMGKEIDRLKDLELPE